MQQRTDAPIQYAPGAQPPHRTASLVGSPSPPGRPLDGEADAIAKVQGWAVTTRLDQSRPPRTQGQKCAGKDGTLTPAFESPRWGPVLPAVGILCAEKAPLSRCSVAAQLAGPGGALLPAFAWWTTRGGTRLMLATATPTIVQVRQDRQYNFAMRRSSIGQNAAQRTRREPRPGQLAGRCRRQQTPARNKHPGNSAQTVEQQDQLHERAELIAAQLMAEEEAEKRARTQAKARKKKATSGARNASPSAAARDPPESSETQQRPARFEDTFANVQGGDSCGFRTESLQMSGFDSAEWNTVSRPKVQPRLHRDFDLAGWKTSKCILQERSGCFCVSKWP